MRSTRIRRSSPRWQQISAWLVPRSLGRRVPVLLQLAALECGAACLAMILTYYGRATTIAECRECCGVGRDGVTALTIVRTARRFGLRVKALSLEPSAFGAVPLPAIVHWNFNHFVVVERWTPDAITIIDPAAGRRRLTAQEFDTGFTGVTLILEPGIDFERRRGGGRRIWLRYLRQFLQLPGVLTQILAASLLLQLLGLALPIVTKVLVDQVLPLRITTALPIIGIGIVLLAAAQLVTGLLRATLLVHLQGRLDSRLMLGFFEHLLQLPFRFFEQRTSGDLLMRLGSNSVIREVLSTQTVSFVLDGAFVLIYLVILFVQAPIFGGLALGLGALQIALLVGTTRWMHGLTQRDLNAHADSQSYVVEALSGIATLKASGTEDRALEHWSNLFYTHLDIALQRNRLSATVDTALTTMRTISPLVLLWVGALQVLNGTLSLGTMLALNTLAVAFLTPLATLVANGQRLQLVGAHLERLADVLEAEPEQDRLSAQPAPPLTGRIEVEQLSFRYDPQAPWVLRDLRFTIAPGQTIALVGRTGSGKSTLARLLLGLYQPTEGTIAYDGLPLPTLDYRSLRSQCGVVLQEASLFSGSLRQNIAFNAPGLALEQVITAARIAAIDDEIARMPMGYETIITEGGNGLSGGQRQRLSIARAVAHTPSILVLDEATSHLDATTERLVDERLRTLRCTRIVIAHRLSTVRHADLILVLDQGRIVERGTHEALLALGGHYAALIHSQHLPDTQPALRAADGGADARDTGSSA